MFIFKHSAARKNRGTSLVTRRAAAERRGANAVEFALVLPLLLVFTFGMLDYSWYFLSAQGALTAAQEGARTGSQVALDDDPEAEALANAQLIASQKYPTNTMNVSCGADLDKNKKVIVTVTMEFIPLLGFVPTPEEYEVSVEQVLEQI